MRTAATTGKSTVLKYEISSTENPASSSRWRN